MCLPLPVFYHILFNVFIFLLPTACTHPANSCLKAVVFAISSTWNLFFHIFVFIAVDVVSHHWDPSSEMKECLPYWVKCCQQAAVSCQPHLGVASAKESCLSQGHVSFLEQPTWNDWLLLRHQSLPPLPQLRATLKGHLSNRVPCGVD